MAKVLKLDRIATYVSPAIENIRLERGQTVRVDDKTAAYLLSDDAVEKGDGDSRFPHFVEVRNADDDTEVTYDIIEKKAERVHAEREAKGLGPVAAAPALRHQKASIEDADEQGTSDAEEEPAPVRRRTQRAAPVAVKKAPLRRIPSRLRA